MLGERCPIIPLTSARGPAPLGATTKSITIVVKGDSKKMSNEYFFLDLFGNSAGAPGPD